MRKIDLACSIGVQVFYQRGKSRWFQLPGVLRTANLAPRMCYARQIRLPGVLYTADLTPRCVIHTVIHTVDFLPKISRRNLNNFSPSASISVWFLYKKTQLSLNSLLQVYPVGQVSFSTESSPPPFLMSTHLNLFQYVSHNHSMV